MSLEYFFLLIKTKLFAVQVMNVPAGGWSMWSTQPSSQMEKTRRGSRLTTETLRVIQVFAAEQHKTASV